MLVPVIRLVESIPSRTKAAVPKALSGEDSLREPSLTATAVPIWMASAIVPPSSVAMSFAQDHSESGGRAFFMVSM